MRQRVVIIGLGDTGLLSAVRLVDDAEVIAISPTNGMVSGQDMGFRIARPKAWASTAVIPFSRYENLDKVRIIHGRAARVEADVRTVVVEHADGERALSELYCEIVEGREPIVELSWIGRIRLQAEVEQGFQGLDSIGRHEGDTDHECGDRQQHKDQHQLTTEQPPDRCDVDAGEIREAGLSTLQSNPCAADHTDRAPEVHQSRGDEATDAGNQIRE